MRVGGPSHRKRRSGYIARMLRLSAVAVVAVLVVGYAGTRDSEAAQTAHRGASNLAAAVRLLKSGGCPLRTEDLLRQDDYAVEAAGVKHCQRRYAHVVRPSGASLVSRSGRTAVVRLRYPDGDVYFGLVRNEGRWWAYAYGQNPKHPRRLPRPPSPSVSGVSHEDLEAAFQGIPSQLGGPLSVTCHEDNSDGFRNWICAQHDGTKYFVTISPGGGIGAAAYSGPGTGSGYVLCCIAVSP
jgi:hypothetical protein